MQEPSKKNRNGFEKMKMMTRAVDRFGRIFVSRTNSKSRANVWVLSLQLSSDTTWKLRIFCREDSFLFKI